MLIVAVIISSLISILALLAVWRLNKYIQRLENLIDDELIQRMDTYEDTLRTVVKEDYLKPDMKAKKPLLPREELI